MRYAMALIGILFFAALVHAQAAEKDTLSLAGLHAPGVVLRDVDGIPHIYAEDEHDALFLQGYLQAQDRLFQLDVSRRMASGTLAELVGESALRSDVALRTIGLRRAAERSLAAYSAEARAGLQAYANGVNAWVERNPLPSEYNFVEVTRFEPWTALDSLCIAKALSFQLSFELDLNLTLQYVEYQHRLLDLEPQRGQQIADQLFFQDLFRSAPFDPASSVPDADSHRIRASGSNRVTGARFDLNAPAVTLLKQIRSQISGVPLMQHVLAREEHQIGSNAWVVAGRFTTDGRALLANDPHLSLDMPATFHDLHITARREGLDLIGSSVAGTPWVVLGQNKSVAWGLTTTGFDVTDTYQEQLVADPNSASGLSTVYQGRLEPVEALPVQFRVNLRDGGMPDSIVPLPAGHGVPATVLIVPRRNHGPILQFDPTTGTAISVQYTGFGPTRELEAFRLLGRARNLKEFEEALQYFDVGSQSFFYGDTEGNIGYFTSGEVPLREDLQRGVVAGAPPWFVRSGQGGNEWVPLSSAGPNDGSGYAYLPFKELPQIVNPHNGFVVNTNNDPSGTTLDNDPLNERRSDGRGIYYLGYTFDYGGRAARITQVLRQRMADARVDRSTMRALQADTVLFDAQVFVPYIVAAFARAGEPQAPQALQAFAHDPQVAEAVQRLSDWNYTTPTGVANGYDAVNDSGFAHPTKKEIRASIAATIYSVWRGQAVTNGIDHKLKDLGLSVPGANAAIKALRHLVEQNGIGTSTIDFFAWTSLSDPAQRRDFVLLKSLRDALDLLGGPAFEQAYFRSTNQNDYRWGRLHRVTLQSILGESFSVPGSTPEFPPSFTGLAGLAVDGGFGTVDVGPHDVRAADANAFVFSFGPNRRYVGSFGDSPGSIDGETILPGGDVATIGSPFYANQLGRWLTDETYNMRQLPSDVVRSLYSRQVFVPQKH